MHIYFTCETVLKLTNNSDWFLRTATSAPISWCHAWLECHVGIMKQPRRLSRSSRRMRQKLAQTHNARVTLLLLLLDRRTWSCLKDVWRSCQRYLTVAPAFAGFTIGLEVIMDIMLKHRDLLIIHFDDKKWDRIIACESRRRGNLNFTSCGARLKIVFPGNG